MAEKTKLIEKIVLEHGMLSKLALHCKKSTVTVRRALCYTRPDNYEDELIRRAAIAKFGGTKISKEVTIPSYITT
jgi:hypothetical protein